MAEEESNLHFERAEGSDPLGEPLLGEPLTDAERAVIRALRASVPVDAAAFDTRVMAAVRREPILASARRRSYRGYVTLSASVAALAAIAVFALIGRGELARDAHVARVAQEGHGARTSLRTVHFTLVASGASRVVVAGSFNGWNTVSTPLRRIGKNTWSADIPLGAGRYEYQFVVDGNRWVADPRAPRGAGDDFGAANSVVTVPMPGSA